MALKDVLQLDVETLVKPYCRIESAADNAIVQLLTDNAIELADQYLCREFEINAKELANIKLGCLQAVAFWYENRGDTGSLPPTALEILKLYRFEPGF